jgi:hypothetical protein
MPLGLLPAVPVVPMPTVTADERAETQYTPARVCGLLDEVEVAEEMSVSVELITQWKRAVDEWNAWCLRVE